MYKKYFRRECRGVNGYEVAERLGLDGQVRNLPDRRVEVLASGTAEQHAALLRSLHEGPPLAQVKEVAVNPAAAEPREPGFRVKY